MKEPTQLPLEKSLSLGDSVSFVSLAVALFVWVLVPTLAEKAVAIIVGAAILAHLAYRSHFTKSIRKRFKHLVALLVLLVLAGGGWQLRVQWKSETQRGIPRPRQFIHPVDDSGHTRSTSSTPSPSRPQDVHDRHSLTVEEKRRFTMPLSSRLEGKM